MASAHKKDPFSKEFIDFIWMAILNSFSFSFSLLFAANLLFITFLSNQFGFDNFLLWNKRNSCDLYSLVTCIRLNSVL